MPFSRFPHNAALVYVESGTFDSIGVYSPSVTSTVIECRVEINSSRFVIGKGGDRQAYQLNVYYPMSVTVPDGAKLSFSGKEYKIFPEAQVQQKYRVLRCGK